MPSWLSNIWNHPKTTIAGALIGVVTVVGVLSQQGISLGSAGTGTVVALIGAIATALLGLVAQDPQRTGSADQGAGPGKKILALVLIGLLGLGTLPVAGSLTGCTSSQLEASAQTLASALTSLASVIQSTDPTTAANLTTAASAVSAAAKAGTSGTTLEQALNAAASGAEVVLAAIPVTAPYAALIAIAVTATEAILASTQASATATTQITPAKAANLAALSKLGRSYVQHRFLRSKSGDFKAAWNRQAVKLGYSGAVIK